MKLFLLLAVVFLVGCHHDDESYDKAMYYYHQEIKYRQQSITEIETATTMIGVDSLAHDRHEAKSDSLYKIADKYADTAAYWHDRFDKQNGF